MNYEWLKYLVIDIIIFSQIIAIYFLIKSKNSAIYQI